MSSIQEIKEERLKKLQKLRAAKINPYTAKTDKNIPINKFLKIDGYVVKSIFIIYLILRPQAL